jgi:hypothetical protein
MIMHSWSEATPSLQKIIISKNNDSLWESFVEYCKLKEQGLRDLAFKKLKIFIINAQQWKQQ